MQGKQQTKEGVQFMAHFFTSFLHFLILSCFAYQNTVLLTHMLLILFRFPLNVFIVLKDKQKSMNLQLLLRMRKHIKTFKGNLR